MQFVIDKSLSEYFSKTGQEIGESADEENIGQETERDGPESCESTVVKDGQE